MCFSHTFFLYSKYKCMYLKHNIDVCYEVLKFFYQYWCSATPLYALF